MFIVTRKRFNEIEAKFRNIVSHATGGASADITRSLNDIAVDISRHRNVIWEEAKESKARELAGDLLHSMHEAERAVLVTLHGEYCRQLPRIAEWTGLSLNDVRTLAKGLVIKGLATFGPAWDEDRGVPAGSGYTLTDEGNALKVRALAEDIGKSASAVEKLAA